MCVPHAGTNTHTPFRRRTTCLFYTKTSRSVYDRGDFVTRRDTNTVTVKLGHAEVLALIRDLADRAYMGDVWLVIESDEILPKEME